MNQIKYCPRVELETLKGFENSTSLGHNELLDFELEKGLFVTLSHVHIRKGSPKKILEKEDLYMFIGYHVYNSYTQTVNK